MDWLEEELKQALERKMPSAGFAERVEQAAASGGGRLHAMPPPSWHAPRRWLAAAAALLLAVSGAAEYRQYQGRKAKERVLLALRITSGKLNRIQARALRTSRHEAQEAPQ